MKASQSGRRWLSIGLVAMLFALLSFSMMPLVTSILKTDRAVSVSFDRQRELEGRAIGYRSVLEREPENRTALRGLLETRLEQGHFSEAIEPLERLTRLEPKQGEYLLLLARAKQQIQDYEGAIGTYRALMATELGNIGALQELTGLLTVRERSDEAIAAVKEIIDRGVNAAKNADAPAGFIDIVSTRLLLGKLYFDRSDYPSALRTYEGAAAIDPGDFRPILGKAIVLKEQGKIADAEPLFQQALDLAPAAYREEIKTLSEVKTNAGKLNEEDRSVSAKP
jgi:tetratricopeptide (TPR) repeat protein